MIVNIHDEPERHVPYERTIEWLWLVSEFEVEDLSDTGTLRYWLRLSCTHHGKAEWSGRPDRCFTAVLDVKNETRMHERPIVRTSIFLGGPNAIRSLLVLKEDVARYSEKRLEMFAVTALARLRAHDDPRIDEMIERAHGLEPSAAA
jgi:hypothetical protein